MRRLLGLVVLAACNNAHHIETSWQIAEYVPGVSWGYAVPCPSGWDTARVIAIDPANPATPDVETFACSDGFVVTSELPANSYVAHIEILNGDKVLAASPLQTVDVTAANPYLTATFFVDAGYIDISWTPCTLETSAILAVTPVVPSSDFTENDTFISCTAGYLEAGPFRQGTYSVTFSRGAGVQTFPDVVVTAPAVTHLPSS